MPAAKIAITLNPELLEQTDKLVEQGIYPNRSSAIASALTREIERQKHERLASQAALLAEEETEIWLEKY